MDLDDNGLFVVRIYFVINILTGFINHFKISVKREYGFRSVNRKLEQVNREIGIIFIYNFQIMVNREPGFMTVNQLTIVERKAV